MKIIITIIKKKTTNKDFLYPILNYFIKALA